MEKREGSRPKEPVQEDLQIQDSKIYREEKVDSDDLHSNRKLHKNKEPTQNVREQNFLRITEENEESCAEEEGLKQETGVNVKQKFVRSAENSLVRAKDLIQTIQIEADAVHKECDELAEDEMVEPERNITVQQINEFPEEISIFPAQDSIPTAEHDSNDAAQQEWDRNADNEQLEANAALQKSELPRKLSILSSEKEGLQQPCEVSEENLKVREEQDIVMQQESATPDKVSETLAEVGVTQYDAQNLEMMKREQELRKMLADYFSKQNQVTMQQRTESPEEILISPTQDSIPTAEHDSDDAAQQEWDRNADNEQLKANAALQKRSELPRKLSILSSEKEGLQQPCEVSEENMKAREQDIVMHQESAAKDIVSETPTEARATQYDAKDQEMMQREQELRKMLADYFSKPSQVNQQEAEICHQKNTHSFYNSEETEPRKLKESVTYGEPGGNWNGYPRELGETLTKCRPAFEDGVLARPQGPKDDATGCHPGTKKVKKLEHGATVPFNAYDVKPERSQSSKDYVTFHRRESDDITARSQNPNDYLSGLPRGSDDASVLPQKTKDYVTFLRREPIVTARSLKTKDYVTLRPRRSDNETLHNKISKRFSPYTYSKAYVTAQPTKQNTTPSAPEPPTHIFWPVRRFPANASTPGSSTKTHVPSQSTQKPASTPDSKEPPHVSLGTQQLKEEKKALPSHPNRTRLRQALILQSQRLSSIPEDDDFSLVPLEEVCPEVAVETNEPGVQRNRKILGVLTPPLSTGIQNLVQRFCEHNIPAERQASFKKLSAGCMGLLCSLLVGGIVTALLYFTTALVESKSDIGGPNVTSPLYDSHLNLNVTVTDAKHYRQSESLDEKVNTPGTRLVESNVNFTTDFDVNITNSLADSDAEIIPVMDDLNDNVNTPDINSESNVATLVTNLGITLINFDFGVTASVNDFDVNFITPVTDFVFNAINPVTDMDVDITIPVTDLNVNFTT
ncbi:hypothetical protein AVEN_236414-1 [Araneus ventricosus]|uniref:Uncharacterized protein n=1 Tax=Araneus ventricosus TaxID=182803 RepID=A0A4Y2ITJ5_ARAVE|nr:hypothetical protein AVEN_236414-1 [Araneus ventricosus]